MDLLREWRRRSFSVAAGAVLAPAAIVAAALAVGLGGGGLGGLGSLDQALAGPDLPAVVPLSQRRSADEAGRLLARARQAAPPSDAATAAPVTATQPVSDTAPAQPTPTEPPGDATASLPPLATVAPTRTRVPVATPAGTQATPAPTTAVPEPEPTTILDSVPIVGGPAGDVVDDLAKTVDGLVP